MGERRFWGEVVGIVDSEEKRARVGCDSLFLNSFEKWSVWKRMTFSLRVFSLTAFFLDIVLSFDLALDGHGSQCGRKDLLVL
mmetsp:Transcript_3195/g.4895  ORF Transcript_3195/g.4895 Transcript_3195/m.4895 type:complete len:82 (+) Transcript_3195:308-553(+)